MRTRSYILIALIWICSLKLLNAQNGNGSIVYRSASKGIEIKWYSQELIYSNGIDIFRSENNGEWKKINDFPIFPAKQLPENLNPDERDIYTMCMDRERDEIKGFLLLNAMIKSFESTEFSKFLGIYFLDNNVKQGSSYNYRVVSMSSVSSRKTIAEQENIQWNGIRDTSFSSPLNIVFKQMGKGVRFKWSNEPQRFYGVNIYRSSDYSDFTKINKLPVVQSNSQNLEGNWAYLDEGLLENVEYIYFLRAINFFGEESVPSEKIKIKVTDQTPPESPKDLTLLETDNRKIRVSWTNPELDRDTETELYLQMSKKPDSGFSNIERLSTKPGKRTIKLDSMDFGAYYFRIMTQDPALNRAYSNIIFVHLEDVEAPDAPTKIKASFSRKEGGVELSWSPGDDQDIMGYRIFRTLDTSDLKSLIPLNAEPVESNFYFDFQTKAKSRNTFYYAVASVDSSFNTGNYSHFISFRFPDENAPAVPVIKGVELQKEFIKIDWIQNVEQDFRTYVVEKKNKGSGWDRINMMELKKDQSFFRDRYFDVNMVLAYRVRAIDSAGNVSAPSDTYEILTQSEKVENTISINASCRTVGKNKTGDKVKLSWDFSDDIEFEQIDKILLVARSENAPFRKMQTLKYSSKNLFLKPKANHVFQVRLFLKNGKVVYSNTCKIF